MGGIFGGTLSFVFGRGMIAIALLAVALAVFGNLVVRTRRAGFPVTSAILSLAGLPVFIYLLVRSYCAFHVSHQVNWRGRTYTNV